MPAKKSKGAGYRQRAARHLPEFQAQEVRNALTQETPVIEPTVPVSVSKEPVMPNVTDAPSPMPPHQSKLSRPQPAPEQYLQQGTTEADARFQEFEQAEATPFEEGNLDPQAQVPTPEPVDQDLQGIMEKFGNDPHKLASAVMQAETARRKSQSEKDMIMASMQGQGPAPMQAQPVAQMTPGVMPNQVNPFDGKALGSKLLDDPETTVQEIGDSLMATVSQQNAGTFKTITDELLLNKYHRKFPGVVTDENWPIIKALASSQPGSTIMEQLDNAAQSYKAQLVPSYQPAGGPSVQEMREAVQAPVQKATQAGGKMKKKSEVDEYIHKLIATNAYTPDKQSKIRSWYASGSVKMDQ